MTLMSLASTHQALRRGDDEPFSSPLLYEAVTRFDRARRHVILEAGSIGPGIMALLQGQRCRILVADSARALSALSEKSQDPEFLLHQIEALIDDAGAEKIDTVLCWDLLNHLTLPVLSAFCTRLAGIMAPAGMLHAYIYTAQSTMPQHPQRYTVLDEGLVVRSDRDPAKRQTPRYSYGDLDKHASGLHVARSMLLRNGIQEYLLCMNQKQADEVSRTEKS
jgi:hypothetical protein